MGRYQPVGRPNGTTASQNVVTPVTVCDPCITKTKKDEYNSKLVQIWHFFGNGSWVAHFVKTGGGSRLLETQPPEMATSL
jgi:hypothetical protein